MHLGEHCFCMFYHFDCSAVHGSLTIGWLRYQISRDRHLVAKLPIPCCHAAIPILSHFGIWMHLAFSLVFFITQIAVSRFSLENRSTS
jgi:hypothetical protein